MSIYKFTGHPFVDAGIAGIAALLEIDSSHPQFSMPESITIDDIENAIEILREWYKMPVVKDNKNLSKKSALCVVLLQEILPGSSWDQIRSKKNIEILQYKKFDDRLDDLQNENKLPNDSCCIFLGNSAHLYADMGQVPLLSSIEERPNCFPNLENGIPISKYVAIAVLFSPLAINKTISSKGAGSANTIIHTENWRFMVELAKRRIIEIRTMQMAQSVADYYKGMKEYGGTYRITLRIFLDILKSQIPEPNSAILWKFNASLKSKNYDLQAIPRTIITLMKKQRKHNWIKPCLENATEEICKKILSGENIIQNSIQKIEKNKKISYYLRPEWQFQRLYAEEVLDVKPQFLDVIEILAMQLCDKKIGQKIIENQKGVKIAEIGKWCPEPLCIAILAEYNGIWPDYLRAALIWLTSGNSFDQKTLGDVCLTDHISIIRMMGDKLSEYSISEIKKWIYGFDRNNPSEYRSTWIEMIRRQRATWEDFIVFCPITDALHSTSYSETRLLRDYLTAYLWSKLTAKKAISSDELIEQDDDIENQIDDNSIINEEETDDTPD